MSVLLHISDTHFGTEQPEVAEALVRMAIALGPDLVVLSGDITQRARRKQFAEARRFVDRLPAPTLALPGNHDIPLFNPWARALHPYRNYSRQFGTDLDPTFDLKDVFVVGVKTTRRYRHKDGEVSDAQIAHVVDRLHRAGPRRLRIVVTHQPAHVLRAEDQANVLQGAASAIAAWAAAGADLILGGHIHLPFAAPLTERYPDLPREMWIAQAGTAVSTRVRHEAPNSVNVIRYERATSQTRYAIERWDYQRGGAQEAEGKFAPVSVVQAMRDPDMAGEPSSNLMYAR